MTMKKNSLFFATLIAFVFAIGLASAASLSISNIEVPSNVEHDARSFDVSFDLRNDGESASIDWSGSTVSNGADVSFDVSNIGDGSVTSVTESVTATVTFDSHRSGNFVGLIVADPSGLGSSESFNFNVQIIDSAEVGLSSTGTLSKSSNATLRVSNEGNVDLDIDLSEVTSFGVIFENTGTISLNPGSEETIVVSLPSTVDLDFGNNVIQIRARDASEGVSQTIDLTVREGFCDVGEVGGNIEIKKVDINNRGSGDDEEWRLLDTVEVEVDVEVNSDDEVEDIIVELGLFDNSGINQVSDLEFDNTDEEEYDIGDLDNDDDEETATFTFQVPADFEAGNYDLAIKAYSDGDEDVQCTHTSDDFDTNDLFTRIDVEQENDEGKFIAFDNVRFTPEQAVCGERVSMTLDVFNIGDETQERTKVLLQNRDLDIDQSIEITSDLDEGDDETVNFEFLIPNDADDGIYSMELTSQYDYSRGTFREVSDEIKTFSLRVSGCSSSGNLGSGGNVAAINAFLDSDAMAGEQLVVRTTVTNLMSDTASFVVDAVNFESWASLQGVTNSVLSLNSGESRDVTFRFDVDEDAFGEESFIVEVRNAASGEREAREIAVNIDGEGSGSGITGSAIGFGDNAYLWVIGIVNVILVVLIIVVAVRISRR